MTRDITNLAAQLAELTETPAPPMHLDIARAREIGRRRRNTRQAALVGGLTTFALVVAAAAAPVLNNNSQELSPGTPSTSPTGSTSASASASASTPPSTSSTTSTPSSPTPPPANAGGVIARASFGWLPEQAAITETWEGGKFPFTSASVSTHVHEGGATSQGTQLAVTVHPATQEPPTLSAFPGTNGENKQITIPADPINGRSAYWVSRTSQPLDSSGDAFLVWQVPDGRWAELRATHLTFADRQAVLLRVAAGVTVADRAVPLPLKLFPPPEVLSSGLFASWLTNVTFHRPMPKQEGNGAWLLRMNFNWVQHGIEFPLVLSPAGTWRTSQNVSCRTAEGIDVCVILDEAKTLGPLGGPEGVLNNVTLLGTDERNWTTDPTR